MKSFQPPLFLSLASILEKAAFNVGERMSEDLKTKWATFISDFEPDCIELELPASLATIKTIRTLVSRPDADYGSLGPLATELQGRLIDEMRGRYFFALSLRETEFYRTPWKNWEDIVLRFPPSMSDVEEASKCFAVSRYPAAIFHSLQVVEVGLIELGTFINVTDPKSGWTAVANELKRIISKAHTDRTEFERQNFTFLEQVQGTVEALKNAWRNKINHAQGKLTLLSKDFSSEIAEEILFATRAFMRRLADGLPPAENEDE